MPRRILNGTVVSAKGDKTIIVRVDRKIKHPLYKKYIMSSKKYAAHDEENEMKEGDGVRIIESKPISKRKKWKLLKEEE